MFKNNLKKPCDVCCHLNCQNIQSIDLKFNLINLNNLKNSIYASSILEHIVCVAGLLVWFPDHTTVSVLSEWWRVVSLSIEDMCRTGFQALDDVLLKRVNVSQSRSAFEHLVYRKATGLPASMQPELGWHCHASTSNLGWAHALQEITLQEIALQFLSGGQRQPCKVWFNLKVVRDLRETAATTVDLQSFLGPKMLRFKRYFLF